MSPGVLYVCMYGFLCMESTTVSLLRHARINLIRIQDIVIHRGWYNKTNRIRPAK